MIELNSILKTSEGPVVLHANLGTGVSNGAVPPIPAGSPKSPARKGLTMLSRRETPLQVVGPHSPFSPQEKEVMASSIAKHLQPDELNHLLAHMRGASV